jgi:hypothetical protein
VALVTKDNAINQSSYVRTKCYVDHQGLVIGGEALGVGDIPSLPTSKITSGVFDIGRIPTGTTSTTVSLGNHNHIFGNLSGISLSSPVSGQVLGFNGTNWTNVASGGGSGSVTLTGDVTGTGTGTFATTLASIGTAGTYTKVTTDAKGRVSSGTTLSATDIPVLDTGKITTGTFDVTRIPNLSTSKITSGVFDISYIPTGTTSTTVALGNHNHTFNSLSGISITSPSNGQILSYDNATSQWKNTTLPAGTGAVNSVDGAFGDVVLTNTYQAKSNELTAIAGLADTVGYIKKTGDGSYILDAGGGSGVTSVDGLTGVVVLSSNYLALTGGSVSGITTFSSATPSTNTTTGAVKISNGGLGVTGSGYFGGDLSHNGFFKKNGEGSAGWTNMTGTADLSTVFDTSTVTLSQVAQRLKGIQDALTSLGILDATGNDPYFANVDLFLKSNGTNNSINIVDSSLSPKSIAVSGNTKISTDQSKYGGSSIYFDGNGDYLQVSVAGGLGSGDFTLEFWIFKIGTGMIFNSRSSGTGADGIDISSSLSTTTNGAIIFSSVTLDSNIWIHVAIVRKTNVFTRFINGVATGTFSLSNNFSNINFSIGGSTAGNVGYLNGYIDSFRFTKNIARYTANFNPETATYLS